MAGVPGWLRARAGVRVASALSAAAVVAVALVISGAALVFLTGQSLRSSLEDTAQQRNEQILQRVRGNFQGEAKQNAIEAVDALATEGELVQVLVDYAPGSPGHDAVVVEGATAAAGDRTPMSSVRPAGDGLVVVPDAQVTRADGRSLPAVLAVTGGSSVGRDVVVLVALPLDSVRAATDTVLFYLLFGVPILIVVAGVATYFFAGRALRPVEAIRVRVAAMTEKDLAQRVPVPAAHDEVGRLAETMNGMIARLENAQGVQRRFVADASHELRSPLATIAAGLELVQRDTSDPGTIAALRVETSRLGRLVDALLLLARADERGLRPRREEVDLDEVAEGERGRPGDGGVRAEVRAEPVRVIGDRGQLVRVLRNLVDNARRHARSRVVVTVARHGDAAVIEVSDDGPGVPAADRARVFERFVRLDDARARSDGGSGLGLAIVAEVVAAHGGTVELADAPGGGALFRVRLPAAARSEEPDVVERAGPDVPPPAPPPPTAVPVRDEDARRDPETAPWGIPVGAPAPRSRAVPTPRGARRDQPGSAIR
jgi:signal transduction histidine kinase